MSTATVKRSFAEALVDAEAFRDLFEGCYERWEIAGSLRRMKAEVGDVEHVVIPIFGEVATTSGLFAEKRRANLIWHRLDELVAYRQVTKHLYSNGFRWGDL